MTEQNFTTNELNNEIWKCIPNYENIYQVSNLGRIKSFASQPNQNAPIVKKCAKNRGGYVFATLYKKGQ